MDKERGVEGERHVDRQSQSRLRNKQIKRYEWIKIDTNRLIHTHTHRHTHTHTHIYIYIYRERERERDDDDDDDDEKDRVGREWIKIDANKA